MFCPQCGTSNDDVSQFCSNCGRPLTAASVPAPYTQQPPPQTMRGPSTAPARYAEGRNPVVALILSGVIVGVGQFYNGDHKKGALMFLGAVVAGLFTSWACGFGWFGIAIWSAIDAYRVAKRTAPLW
ncbi:MAG TPA: zinc-ribbon domain-containing protein [Thermoanaerobaculia bacterium]|nr:zinc-ribbon domain-containing protein [Thermoanaerobaculia bacterium]